MMKLGRVSEVRAHYPIEEESVKYTSLPSKPKAIMLNKVKFLPAKIYL